MANEKRLIGYDPVTFESFTRHATKHREPYDHYDMGYVDAVDQIEYWMDANTVDAYTAHEVAEIIADLFGDTCACNFNRIDEWLPEKCELLDACPDTVGVACWEQYLKYRRSAKMDGDGNG